MKPALRLTGRVIDAATKKPVGVFHVTSGLAWENGHIAWDRTAKRTYHDGAFVWEGVRIGTPLAFLIQADGYKDLQTSAFSTSQVAASETFELRAK